MNHLQTQAARAARAASRRANEELRIANRYKLLVFTVRLTGSAFGWELRQFGSIVQQRGSESFLSAELARQAGEAALEKLNA